MSSSSSFTDLFLPKQCYAKLPYMSRDKDTWETCARKRADVSVKIFLMVILVVALIILYVWNRQRQEDPTIAFPVGILMVATVIVGLIFVLYPMYAEKSAAVEYDAYESEKAEFLRQNPSFGMRDYLKYKMDEANTRHMGTLSSAQSVMAGAMMADTLSGMFGGRRR